MATNLLPWHPLLLPCKKPLQYSPNRRLVIQSFRRGDFDAFKSRIASGEFWRDANDRFEQLVYETKKTAQSIDRRYSVSRRLSAVAQSAAYRAKELDNDFAITQRWRDFTLDWPRYRKQLSEFLDTPLGKSVGTVFFLWFALSGWLFRTLIFATWVLPFAGPLLIGAFANNLVIKGSCPACKKQFVGYKNQKVQCSGCGNTVWQPEGDFFSRGSGGMPGTSKSKPDIIDVEFEEK